MRIASISKPLTCLLAAKLVESNLLDLDLPIDNYLNDLPQFKLLNDKTNRTYKINARQLMSHTSGILLIAQIIPPII
jgi:CubicO group peptidase (beta-lactamase class C family)